MALVPGTRLGPYEVVAPLGAGGMGEVYKARDTRLGRLVALKVLREHLANDPDRRVRFDREARAISKLNHQNICTLYDVGHDNDIDYIVVEYIEGQTLADRLTKGALPIDQALAIAIAIAAALDAAHRAGIIHRDLKPANVMLTKDGAKLLDFGIARIASPETLLTAAATRDTLTTDGSLIGTVQYMSPEQLEGRDADARSDIFAFGAVTYEMLTGRRPFTGDTNAAVVASILDREPEPLFDAPVAVIRLVQKCLSKDPERRWQSAGDLCDELKWTANLPKQPLAQTAPRSFGWLGWSIAALALIAAIALGVAVLLRTPAADPRVYRSTFALPAPVNSVVSFAASPDGRQVAISAPDATGRAILWIRPLDALAAQPLMGTEGAAAPFWSPDSRSIGFFAGGKLKRVSAAGGPVATIADALSSLPGAWGRDDTILFTPNAGVSTLGTPIARVAASGGQVTPVTRKEGDELMHGLPSFLPDGRHFLFTTFAVRGAGGAVYVGSLDSNARFKVLEGVTNAQYARGVLFFLRDGTLMGQEFDTKAFQLKGEATPVAQQVWLASPRYLIGAYTASEGGVLAFQVGGGGDGKSQLTWFDRKGNRLGTLGDQENYEGVTANPSAELNVSPDGTRVTVVITDSNGQPDIWIFDVARRTRTRFTVDPGGASAPIWSPDGTKILYRSIRDKTSQLYWKRSDGAGSEELVTSDRSGKIAESWSPDGRYVLYYVGGPPPIVQDIWALPLFGNRKPFPFIQSPFNDRRSQFSPDGHWVAYQSNESGRVEVYVVPFPGPGGKIRVSAEGGHEPRWRRDGKELFFLAGMTLMAAPVTTIRDKLTIGDSTKLFDVRVSRNANEVYDVTADGQRFLVDIAADPPTSPVTVVVNWPALLKH